MDWKECKDKKIVRESKVDENLIKSIKEIANEKIKSANSLPKSHYYGKISLLYEALRENLEYFALKKGYKVYNHECYVSFLKEILLKTEEGYLFDELRIIRNDINYNGKKLTEEDGNAIVSKLNLLISKLNEE